MAQANQQQSVWKVDSSPAIQSYTLANLRKLPQLENFSEESGLHFLKPNKAYTMDNAGMIGASAYFHAKNNNFTDWKDLIADPNWKVYQQ